MSAVTLLRVGICPDFREEGWPSMDRVADALLTHLRREHAHSIEAAPIAPPFMRRVSRLAAGRAAVNMDRGINRLWDYPRHVSGLASEYDVFHVIDHSYSQLVHRLPASRTVVTCHDLDTFRSLFDPAHEPRSEAFKAMTRHILAGLRSAACVTCDTASVAGELTERGLVRGERVVVAPIGVDAVFSSEPDAEADAEAARVVNSPAGAIELVHVGSTVPRKRIETLLQIVAGIRTVVPDVRLVRVGGGFTGEQRRRVGELGLAAHVSVLPRLDDRLLAAVYRRASLLLLPSEREGFGLPVVEALRCGTAVVASDLPVLREVGSGAVDHCRVDDVDAWVRQAIERLRQRAACPDAWKDRADRGVVAVRRFSWSEFAGTMAHVYAGLGQAACRG